jgi:hypothetical protein
MTLTPFGELPHFFGSSTRRCFMTRVFIGLLVIAVCRGVSAAPLFYLTLEGRAFGSNDEFSGNVQVQVGDTIEYRLRASMAAHGTTNQHHFRNRIDSYRPDKHGLNSLSVSLVQDPSAAIQVDFQTPVTFAPDGPSGNDGWGRGISVNHGTPTLRAGSTSNDLIDVRPIHAAGVFTAHTVETVFSGMFTVAELLGPSGEVRAEWGPWSGGGWFDGYVFFLAGPNAQREYFHCPGCSGPRDTESSADPVAHFTPLTLTAAGVESVPEPSAFALFGAGVIAFALLRRSSVGR